MKVVIIKDFDRSENKVGLLVFKYVHQRLFWCRFIIHNILVITTFYKEYT